jgi:hypothetical protein
MEWPTATHLGWQGAQVGLDASGSVEVGGVRGAPKDDAAAKAAASQG